MKLIIRKKTGQIVGRTDAIISVPDALQVVDYTPSADELTKIEGNYEMWWKNGTLLLEKGGLQVQQERKIAKEDSREQISSALEEFKKKPLVDSDLVLLLEGVLTHLKND